MTSAIPLPPPAPRDTHLTTRTANPRLARQDLNPAPAIEYTSVARNQPPPPLYDHFGVAPSVGSRQFRRLLSHLARRIELPIYLTASVAWSASLQKHPAQYE